MLININIYAYTDYRLLIADRFKQLQENENMTYRHFSALAGFSSPNFLQLLIKGKRNLSLEGAKKVALGLKLSAGEAQYFEILVLANQSKNLQQKQELTEKLIKMKSSGQTIKQSKKDNLKDYEYYRHWFNIPIRESLLVDREKPISHEMLAKAFWPKLSKHDVQNAIKTLLQTGMIKKDSRGRYSISTEETIRTKDFIMNALIINFHTKMLDLAKLAIHEIPSEKRELGGVTVALSENSFREARSLVKEFKAKILELAENDKNKKDVYQVGFQLFPLTRGLDDEK